MKMQPDEIEKYKGESLKTLVPKLDDDGLDLLSVLKYICIFVFYLYKQKMLKSNPAERISAKNALAHPYFNDVPESLKRIYT